MQVAIDKPFEPRTKDTRDNFDTQLFATSICKSILFLAYFIWVWIFELHSSLHTSLVKSCDHHVDLSIEIPQLLVQFRPVLWYTCQAGLCILNQ